MMVEQDAAARLIVALDMPEIAMARAMIRRLDGLASFFKLGPWSFLTPGFEGLLDELLSSGKRVFLDSKNSDIPETMRACTEGSARRGIAFQTIHGHDEVSDEAIAAAVEGKGHSDLKLLAVTVLTSLGPADLGGRTIEDVVVRRAQRAQRLGCDGVIASGREARAIRAALPASSRRFLIVTPGIRPAGTGTEDHSRPATPAAAIEAGADYLVVGRPIVRAADPAAAAAAVIEEIRGAFGNGTGLAP